MDERTDTPQKISIQPKSVDLHARLRQHSGEDVLLGKVTKLMPLSRTLNLLETTELGTEPPFEPGKTGLVALIQELDRRRRAGEDVTLGAAIDQPGARMHGAAILLMALPECIPLPIPSFGAILGVPLVAVSAHLALYGESANLPAKARTIGLPPRMIELMSRYLIGPLGYTEHLSRPRVSILASREKLVGIACLLMSLLLLLPIPLMNVPPAIALVFLSWGLVQRDGLFIGIGIGIATGVVLSLLAIADLLASLLGGTGGA